MAEMTQNGTLEVVIVDDEPLVRRELARSVSELSDIVVVGEATSGPEAVEVVERERPDILFLDIKMPGADGFEVLEALDPDLLPAVIFVTAFDAYAVRAFAVHAVDYLLKPFDDARVHLAVARARARLRSRAQHLTPQELKTLIREIRWDLGTRVRRIPARLGNRISFVDVTQIRWIEASGNYVRLYTAEGSHLVRRTMAELQEQLSRQGFVRIHRSFALNLAIVHELRPKPSGDAIAVLDGGEELPVSRSYRTAFEAAMGRVRPTGG